MPYIPHNGQDLREMLEACGCKTLDELWKKTGAPQKSSEIAIPEGKSEFEVLQHLRKLGELNSTRLTNFLGCGYYDHIIPATVGAITSRSEFYTAYTPYQPEASQGTLQAMFEYQSAICRLTSMDVSNASVYDGGTALFEAMMMSVRITSRREAVISKAVSPIFREMIRCYSSNLDVSLVEVEEDGTASDIEKICAAVSNNTACVIVQYPNVFGSIEDWTEVTAKIRAKGAMSVCSVYPVALGLVKTPGEMGFDIVTGEGQSLGSPLNFGGPYLGFMAVRGKYVRKMPGRIAGIATDKNGNKGFTLTLQTREQHIRREHAMSNICSNETLCALAAIVYLCSLGKNGFAKVARLCNSKANFLVDELRKIQGVEILNSEPFFNEFVVTLPCDASEAVSKMIDKGFAAGFPLGRYYPKRKNQMLVAVTEKRTREEMKSFANAMEAVLWN